MLDSCTILIARDDLNSMFPPLFSCALYVDIMLTKRKSTFKSVTELTVFFILFQSYLFPTKKRKTESSGGDARLMWEETHCSHGPLRTLRETG